MMRSALFFTLSVSLHATALLYPVSFVARSPAPLIPVTILPMDPDSGPGAPQSRGNDSSFMRSHTVLRPKSKAPYSVETKPTEHPQPQTLADDAATRSKDGNVFLASSVMESVTTIDSPASNTDQHDDSSLGGTGGIGTGSGGAGLSGAGSGRGNGSSSGAGSAGSGGALAQARYRDTPRPEYPDSARREGREGRVLLRVLVDEQGRTKRVEINHSSGSEVLDRAAVQAMQRWSFYPARIADKPVESWLKVPIEFHLADATTR
ncbi:MAG TPA: energy transducer TonB [Terriglobales bacterium]|nr:energy transducer TonB [Terriglobales bacterium]